ncbi:hypothetical protein CHCC20348_3523 [Bacillus paralicheniformis]|nr:hypothetical protein CHCC4186_1443 [Bacillus paralicheniformis]TWK48000.1 hypothetical protein CHCC20348_3523 [Bacillus paralicheniformis]
MIDFSKIDAAIAWNSEHPLQKRLLERFSFLLAFLYDLEARVFKMNVPNTVHMLL